MITRKKSKSSGIRYLQSDVPLDIGATYLVSDGPAKGQAVRVTARQPRIVGPANYYDFEARENGVFYAANPEREGICSSCGEPKVICDCNNA